MLRSALLAEPANEADRIAQQRMKGMHELIETMSNWFDDVQRMDHKTLMQLMKMGSKVQRLLELTGKFKPASAPRSDG
jgi:DNA-binding transcriptional regulator GbsR (MarR family)